MRCSTINPSQSTEVDQLEKALKPVSFGKPVQIMMVVIGTQRRDTRKYVEKDRLVLLTPGHIHGMPTHTVLISIVGKGSTIVDVRQPEKIASLVLAGMPGKLARALMNALHRTFGE